METYVVKLEIIHECAAATPGRALLATVALVCRLAWTLLPLLVQARAGVSELTETTLEVRAGCDGFDLAARAAQV